MFNYTFKAVQFAFAHPLAGTFVMNGEQANGGITITNATEHTIQTVTPDGAVIMNFIPGDNGGLQLQCEQIASLHEFLINWHNTVVALAKGGDLSNYATGSALVLDLNTGASHTLQGITPTKIPDKVYGSQSQMVTWTLNAAKVINE